MSQWIQEARCWIGLHPEALQPVSNPTTRCCSACGKCWTPWHLRSFL
jgi:hypothetical protein